MEKIRNKSKNKSEKVETSIANKFDKKTNPTTLDQKNKNQLESTSKSKLNEKNTQINVKQIGDATLQKKKKKPATNTDKGIFESIKEKTITAKQNKDSSNKLHLFLGTYNGIIVKVTVELPSVNNLTTEKLSYKSESFKSSETMIKTICEHDNRYIFTSGTDEIIRIYDALENSEKGIIVSYSGTIGKILIFKQYLFAMCDNNIEIFKLKTFSKVNSLVAHKHCINAFIIHSSGKLLFTVARDNYLMMWNLVKYKCSYRYKFSGLELISLNWMHNEKYIIVGFVNKFIILDYLKDSQDFDSWNIYEHKIATSFDNPGKIVDIKVYKEKYIFVFKTNFDVEVIRTNFNEEENKKEFDVKYFTTKKVQEDNIRLKLVEIKCKDDYNFLVTVNSDNEIRLFNIDSIISRIFNKNNSKKDSDNEDKQKEVIVVESLNNINLIVDRFTCLSLLIEKSDSSLVEKADSSSNEDLN